MKQGIYLAMPVYQGQLHIRETIQSILDQTFVDYRLLMSVDGRDDPTVEICREYSSDPRIDVVVQAERLGWPGNLNWLIQACDREYFCYWQQDDIASTGYLEALYKLLALRPDAAIAYTDVQWFGAAFHRESVPSIEGDPLPRVMQHVENIRFEPFRGLMRASMLPSAEEAIPVTGDESHQEEFVFLAKMASRGAFLRCPDALYFKRLHGDNTFVRWRRFSGSMRRRGWISMGVGMYRIAAEVAPPELRPKILAQVLDRLIVGRPGRGFFYEVPEDDVDSFVRDFLAAARFPREELGNPTSPSHVLNRPVASEITDALEREIARYREIGALVDELVDSGSISVSAAEERARPLLAGGWSYQEAWGVWSAADLVTIEVPSPLGTSWTASIEAMAYAPHGPVNIGVGVGRGPMTYRVVENGGPFTIEIGSSSGDSPIRLHLPDSVSPLDAGESDDSRLLGVGLISMTYELT